MGEAFWSQYLDPNKSSASTQLSHWLTRVLKRIGFSVRKNTVSQKIPDDWQDQSRAFSKECLKFFREKDVSVIVCADQTFVNFLLAKEKLLVPEGTRRVGSAVETDDERKGVTLMLSAYIWRQPNKNTINCGVLPPFMVFNGKTGATLDKRYRD